jgi:hypothetical protein
MAAIPAQGRAAAGNKSRKDNKEAFVDLAKHGPPALLTVLAGTKTEAKRARARARKPKKGRASSRKA